MTIELRSLRDERAAIAVPKQVCKLDTPINGTVCSRAGDEYPIRSNIIDMLGDSGTGESSIAKGTNHWKVTVGIYEDLWRKRSLTILTGEDFPVEKEKELLLDWVNPQAGGLYLDIGCSTALYGRILKNAEQTADIIAMDVSFPMLEEARIKAEAEQVDLYLLRANADSMPFFGKSFDGLVMGGTLNELQDPIKVLFECRRILKESGVFFMMHLIKAQYWYGRFIQDSAEWSGISFPTVAESNDLFNRAGFSVTDQFTKGIVCFSRLKAE